MMKLSFFLSCYSLQFHSDNSNSFGMVPPQQKVLMIFRRSRNAQPSGPKDIRFACPYVLTAHKMVHIFSKVQETVPLFFPH